MCWCRRQSLADPLFERSLSVVANFFGKTAMVRPELARHASLFAKLIEQVGIALDLPAAVGKDQIVAAAKGFEQMLGHSQWC